MDCPNGHHLLILNGGRRVCIRCDYSPDNVRQRAERAVRNFLVWKRTGHPAGDGRYRREVAGGVPAYPGLSQDDMLDFLHIQYLDGIRWFAKMASSEKKALWAVLYYDAEISHPGYDKAIGMVEVWFK